MGSRQSRRMARSAGEACHSASSISSGSSAFLMRMASPTAASPASSSSRAEPDRRGPVRDEQPATGPGPYRDHLASLEQPQRLVERTHRDAAPGPDILLGAEAGAGRHGGGEASHMIGRLLGAGAPGGMLPVAAPEGHLGLADVGADRPGVLIGRGHSRLL